MDKLFLDYSDSHIKVLLTLLVELLGELALVDVLVLLLLLLEHHSPLGAGC